MGRTGLHLEGQSTFYAIASKNFLFRGDAHSGIKIPRSICTVMLQSSKQNYCNKLFSDRIFILSDPEPGQEEQLRRQRIFFFFFGGGVRVRERVSVISVVCAF